VTFPRFRGDLFRILCDVSGAKLLIMLGLTLTALGAVWYFAPEAFPKLFSWFGRLPGDIRIRGENSFVFIPITSMLLVSLAVSLILRLFR